MRCLSRMITCAIVTCTPVGFRERKLTRPRTVGGPHCTRQARHWQQAHQHRRIESGRLGDCVRRTEVQRHHGEVQLDDKDAEPMTRDQCLSQLGKIPTLAAVDHRYFLNKEGRDVRLESLSRHDRRRIEAESRRLVSRYRQILISLYEGGRKYPVDRLLRALAIEYTRRYASSGAMTQPASFNYFEPFCEIKLIDRSTAPYAATRDEYDHLFSVSDFFEYLTSSDARKFSSADLLNLPEGVIYHFTQNGSLSDFTYRTGANGLNCLPTERADGGVPSIGSPDVPALKRNARQTASSCPTPIKKYPRGAGGKKRRPGSQRGDPTRIS
jgi:hypothetical protein